MKIVLLSGGTSPEREVSLSTGKAIYESLKKTNHEIFNIDFDGNLQKIKDIAPDVVFNALHGGFGEDGRLQGALDILKIPYTHSGYQACNIAMNKELSKIFFTKNNIISANYQIFDRNDNPKNSDVKISLPFVVKPIDKGSSFGVEIYKSEFSIENYHWQYGNRIIIEKYIEGQEIDVVIIGNEAAGAIEVKPAKEFFDYHAKYVSNQTQYEIPPQITKEKYQQAMDIGLQIHKLFGCKSLSRVEMILSKADNQFYALELNTHPGFTKTSIVPKVAKYKGMEFDEVVDLLIREAGFAIE